MPRARKPLAAAATPAATKPTAQKWQSRKPAEKGNTLTHERLEEQMKAFRKAGGKIEVLGTTRSLRNIAQSTDQKAANSQPATVKRETSR